MPSSAPRVEPYRLLWGFLLVALAVATALWVSEINQVLHGRPGQAAVASPSTVSVLPPPGGILSPARCQFVGNGPGNTVVLSAATGTVLSAAQAKNC